MTEFPFDHKDSIILCHGEIVSPNIELSLKLALDTGATLTMIPVEAAKACGFDLLRTKRKIEIMTGSGIEHVPVIVLPEFRAFGVGIKNLEVICHNLPAKSPVDGLLGLNFIRKAHLIIDFSRNVVRMPGAQL